ncbi:MAG: tetratricopeptide repeat protein [Myxococcota bacterium]
MRIQLPTLLALLLLGVLACQSDEAKLAQHLERGDEYMEAEQWAEAIIEFKNVVQIDPNHAEGHFQLSQAYLRAEKTREGFWELRETVRLDPDNMDAKLQFAQISIYAGDLEEALKRAEEVIAADPDRADAYMVKGQALEALKRSEEARETFAKAVEVEPDNRGALLLHATFLRRAGDRAAAEPMFERATVADPSVSTFLAYGGFLAEERRDEEALAAYRQAGELVTTDRERTQVYTVLGSFLHRRERFDEAEAAMEEGIAASEEPLELIYLLARMYRDRGEEAKADAMAIRATEARPEDPAPFLVLSSYRGQTGDLEGALEAAEKAMALSEPDDPAARLRVAEVLLELGFRGGDQEKVDRGRAIVEEVVAQDASDPAALFVKAKLDIAEQRTEEAITSLRAAIDLKPDWAKAHFLLGTALSLTGERTAARTELARALEIDATMIDARRVLADVHAALGEHEYAVEEGRRYLTHVPGHTKTRIRVAQSLVLLGRQDEALAEVESIDEASRNGDVNYAIGRIHMTRGDYVTARPYLEKALEQMPGTAVILQALLQVDNREGKLDESVARIEKAVQENPDDAELQQLRGRLALVQGRSADAEAAFKKAIELAPDLISSYRELAQFYARTGRTGETIQTYEKALEVQPDQPQIHHFLGVLYEYGGQRDRAIEHYEAAIRYEPNLGEAKNNLAYIYAEQGENLDRALGLAQEAKALMPDNANAADTLGWVLYRRGVPSAAVGYLKEAVAGTKEGDANLGLVRFHLAQAYEASGDAQMAKETVTLALADQDAFVEAQQAQGATATAEPGWVADARAMQERL